MTQINAAFTLFLSLLITSFPFLLLGIVVSSWLLVFVDEHQLVAKLPRSRILGAIVGSSLGMLIPVCQYGTIPVMRRLLLQGVPIPLVISFLVAAPTVNPFVIWLTWKTFPDRPSMILLRIMLAWSMGIIIALIFSSYQERRATPEETITKLETHSTLLRSGTLLLPSPDSQPLHRMGNLIYEYPLTTPLQRTSSTQLGLFFENMRLEVLELGSIFLLGCAISAIIQIILPQAQLLAWGQSPERQLLVMLLLALILSLSPIANLGFVTSLTSTFLNGSLLTFLLFGSVIDLTSLGLMLTTLRPKIVLYLGILWVQLTFFSGLVLNFYVS